MGVEIERKFLVSGDDWKQAQPVFYCQGYLNRDKMRTVRVRIAGDQAWLTIKGPTDSMSRDEFEYSIPVNDAEKMLVLCEKPLVEKNRRVVEYDGMHWEVDEFLGENQGLVIAEVELESVDQDIAIPDWVGEEVTHDSRYFNSNLSIRPYGEWKHEQ